MTRNSDNSLLMMTFFSNENFFFAARESQPTERPDLFCFLEEYFPRKINYETVPKCMQSGKKTTTGLHLHSVSTRWTISLRNTLWPNSVAQKTRR
jgi:hypothetical protein